MKKWIIVLLIILAPMAAYFVFDKNISKEGIPAAVANDRPTVYKFTSTMCMDCKELGKLMKEMEPQYKDKINFISISVDTDNKTTKEQILKYKINLVPTLILVDKNGKETLKIEGLIEKQLLESKFKALING